jgi:spore maturation protein CgeB
VDSPTFILEDFKKQRSPYLSIFLWDRDYCDEIAARGFEHVAALPLATDTDLFNKNRTQSAAARFACDVGFVGNSGSSIIAECLQELGDDRRTQALLEKIAGAFAGSPARYLDDLALELDPDEQRLFAVLMRENRKNLEPAVTWQATQRYRVACVSRLMKFRPHIYGDAGWKQHLNGHAVLRPELNYYEELPDFYGACAVNFNTTSLQMKGGINQRVFDVPACGSFLLTDYRRQLEQVFEPGREVVCYSSIEEIEDLTAYYVQHEHERRQIAARAHARVLQEHTYVHRLTRLVERMRRLYG